MPSLGEEYAAVAASVIAGETDEPAAIKRLVEISGGHIDDFDAAGVLELHLMGTRVVQRVSNPLAEDRYGPRERLKWRLADSVASGQTTLEDAADELGMGLDHASVVLGAHRIEIYSLPLRDHMLKLADTPINSAIELARAMETEQARSSRLSPYPPISRIHPPGYPDSPPPPVSSTTRRL